MQGKWFLISGFCFSVFLLANVLYGKIKRNQFQLAFARKLIGFDVSQTLIVRATYISVVIMAVLGGLYASQHWLLFEQYFHQTAFNIADPLFQKDVAFYVFSLPLMQLLLHLFWLALIASVFLMSTLYILTGSVFTAKGNLRLRPNAASHMLLLLSVFFIIKSMDYYLQINQLVYSSRGVVLGAGYTDMYAHLPILRILMAFSLLMGLLILYLKRKNNLRILSFSLAAFFIVTVVIGTVYPQIVQRLYVEPNELARERPYIENNLEYTRMAYSLNHVNERSYELETITAGSFVEDNQQALANVRLWDWRPLIQTYNQLQSIRPYYVFNDVDVGRYLIDGEISQVMVSPRELDIKSLPEQARNWINKHLKYTHGYGIVMNRAAESTLQGYPDLIIRDIPPLSTYDDLKVDKPQIYFGEKTNEYVIINTKEKEFDYPIGTENAETVYAGTDGVNIGSFLNRTAFAYRFKSYRILFSEGIQAESRVLFNRNIVDRVNLIAPFLHFDRDPYIVLDEGKLYWIIDAYTMSDRYPYSEPYVPSNENQPRHLTGINYIRNSVKVVIDAYQGTVDFYVADQQDPLIQTYESIFPQMFEPIEKMPKGIRSHTRYPVDYFSVQAEMYRGYHITNPDSYYNKEDYWDLPQEKYAEEKIPLEPYYVMTKLPETDFSGNELEFVLLLPFTPTERQNMISWLIARNDGESYGQLWNYRLSRQELIYGPEQIEARIDQDSEISQLMTLWNQGGSEVIRGNLTALPLEGSILYIEPVYLQSTGTKMPQLIRIIAAYKEQIIMAESLKEALERLFLDSSVPQRPSAPATSKDLESAIEELSALYQQANDFLKAGNWAEYGETMESLGNKIQEVEGMIE